MLRRRKKRSEGDCLETGVGRRWGGNVRFASLTGREVCIIDTYVQVQRDLWFGGKDYKFLSSLVAFDPTIEQPYGS